MAFFAEMKQEPTTALKLVCTYMQSLLKQTSTSKCLVLTTLHMHVCRKSFLLENGVSVYEVNIEVNIRRKYCEESHLNTVQYYTLCVCVHALSMFGSRNHVSMPIGSTVLPIHT